MLHFVCMLLNVLSCFSSGAQSQGFHTTIQEKRKHKRRHHKKEVHTPQFDYFCSAAFVHGPFGVRTSGALDVARPDEAEIGFLAHLSHRFPVPLTSIH